MTTAEVTLEQRRVDTWNAIHQAAATLALEEGLTQSTIDAIANQAGISRRTFFNYFPTKEDAVLGLLAPEVPAEALAEFRAVEDDLFTGLVHFTIAVSRSSYRLTPDPKLRRKLIKRFPELRLRQLHYAGLAESLVAPILDEKLPSSEDNNAEKDDATAMAMLMLARTIVQFAYARQTVPGRITRPEMDAAIASFRNVLEVIR